MSKKSKKPKKPIDPVHILGNARAFQNAAATLYYHYENGPLRVIPQMVCGTFSLELHLKCLHRIRRRYVEGHDPKILFEKLSKADRKKIIAIFNRVIKGHAFYAQFLASGIPLDIDSVLTRASNLFIAMRYVHEGKWPNRDANGWAGNTGIDRLADSIRDFVIEIHPEYVEKCDNLKMEFTEVPPPPLPSFGFRNGT